MGIYRSYVVYVKPKMQLSDAVDKIYPSPTAKLMMLKNKFKSVLIFLNERSLCRLLKEDMPLMC